jgi:hypothetical protein
MRTRNVTLIIVVAAILLLTGYWYKGVVMRSARAVAGRPSIREAHANRHPIDVAKFQASFTELLKANQGARALRDVPNRSTFMTSDQMLEAEIGGQLFALRDKLILTDEEKQKVIDVFALYQIVKAQFEAQIASVNFDGADHLKIEIPSYASTGKILKEQFYSAMTEAIGQEGCRRVDEELGGYFDDRFRAFGYSTQVITVEARQAKGGLIVYQIRSDGFAAPGAQSDPVVGASVFASNSSAYSLVRSQLDAGEWQGYAAYIEKLTPRR